MSNKPTYEELEQRVKELEQDTVEHKQIEKELQESQFLFSEMFEQSTTSILLKTDINTTLTYYIDEI